MTSPLPPKRRDSVNLANLLRQDRTRLGQLDRGLVGGRFPSARPLKPSTADADLEDDAPDDQILFRNVDTVTATGPGTLTFPLSYEPIDGSLQVWWGGVPQPPTEWTLNGSTVTIPDPDSRIAAGRKFTAYYAYNDVEADVPTLDAITFRGLSKTIGALSTPVPAATQVGDTLLVIMVNLNGTIDAACTDSRVTEVDSALMTSPRTTHFSRVYMGTATTLADLNFTGPSPGNDLTVFVLAFAEPMTATSHAGTDSANTTPKAAPAVASSAALCVATQANNVTSGGSPVISGTGWTAVSDSGSNGNLTEFAVAKFLDTLASTTPAGTVSMGTGDGTKGFWVLTIGVHPA